MCKVMMGQRAKIEEMLNEDLERCLKIIREKGRCIMPNVRLDLETLFIANREYFERQGFFFDEEHRVENNQVKYYAWLRLGGDEGELAAQYWKKIKEAEKTFVKNQRQAISDRLRDAQGCSISVDMNQLLFENKLFFEERGYYFEPDVRIENGKAVCLARMKRHI